MATSAVVPFLETLDQLLEQNPKRRAFLQLDMRVLRQYRKRKFSDKQFIAYIWSIAMTDSLACIAKAKADQTDALTIEEWGVLLDCSKKQAFNLLKDSADRGLLRREKDNKGRGFRFSPCPAAELALCPDRNCARPTPVESAPPAEEELPEGDDARVERDGKVVLKEVKVKPGAQTKELKLGGAAVHKVAYQNDTGTPLKLSGEAVNGVLLVRFTEGEEKASDSNEANRSRSNKLLRNLSPSRQFLDENFFGPRFGVPCGDPLWLRITSAAGSTPLDFVARFIVRKAAEFDTARRRVSLSIIESWARFAKQDYKPLHLVARQKTAPSPPVVADGPFEVWLKLHRIEPPRDGAELAGLVDQFERERKSGLK